jgi:arylsulfatase A-like enzyme
VRIVYIDIDSLRPSHVGAYGYHRATSPNIDSLAARGAVFTRCYASDVPCLPSRTALFSGRFGIHTGVVGHAGSASRMRYPGDGHTTDVERRPLALALSLGGVKSVSVSTFANRHLAWHFLAGWDLLVKTGNRGGHETAEEVAAPVLEWLAANGRDESFFLHVNFWDPHTPYRTPIEYGNPFEGQEPPTWMTAARLAALRGDFGPRGARDLISRDLGGGLPRVPREMASLEDYTTWINGYDTGIRYADDQVGRIIETLESLGTLDDTTVIVSADHGENQGELNVFGDHATADDATARVPLIIAGPGISAGRHDQLVYQLDLAPTVCELAGVDVPARWDGRSLLPIVEGTEKDGREYLVIGQGAWTCQRAVRTKTHLLVRTYHGGLQSFPDVMLFDLDADPHETVDLAPTEPDLVKELDHHLAGWWQACLGGEDAVADPMIAVMAEGGPLYPRIYRRSYLAHLRRTGRGGIADRLEQRFAEPPGQVAAWPVTEGTSWD